MLKGKVCKVIADTDDNFSKGELVVALEDHPAPYCCPLEKYNPKIPRSKYNRGVIHPLYCFELEVLYDWTEK